MCVAPQEVRRLSCLYHPQARRSAFICNLLPPFFNQGTFVDRMMPVHASMSCPFFLMYQGPSFRVCLIIRATHTHTPSPLPLLSSVREHHSMPFYFAPSLAAAWHECMVTTTSTCLFLFCGLCACDDLFMCMQMSYHKSTSIHPHSHTQTHTYTTHARHTHAPLKRT